MKYFAIIWLSFYVSCHAQINKAGGILYTPVEISYEKKLNSKKNEIRGFTVMNYTFTNPLIARQIFDKSKKEFLNINSQISFSSKECELKINSYVEKKTDPAYSGIFYNPYFNGNLKGIKVSETIYFNVFQRDTIYNKCVCIPTNYLLLPKDLKETLSEYDLPGGIILEKKNFVSSRVFDDIQTLDFLEIRNTKFFIMSNSLKPQNYRKIMVNKSYIFREPKKRTNSYLVKGNEVEIIKEKDNWLKIRYQGKKIIEGWIKKSDIE